MVPMDATDSQLVPMVGAGDAAAQEITPEDFAATCGEELQQTLDVANWQAGPRPRPSHAGSKRWVSSNSQGAPAHSTKGMN